MNSKTRTQKGNNVKRSELQDMPLRQRKFVKAYKETGNGTKSAIQAGYSEASAATQASRLLRNEKVLAILNSAVEEAEGTIRSLMQSDNEAIRLAASKETLDRTIGKPIQRSESVNVNISVETMLGTGED